MFLSIWFIMLDIILLCIIVFMPFFIAFPDSISPKGIYWFYLIDFFHILDIIVNFNTADYDLNGEMITNRKLICKNYLKLWFWVDFISILPVEFFIKSLIQHPDNTRITTYQKMYKIISLQKLNRLVKLFQVFHKKSSYSFKYLNESALITLFKQFGDLIKYFFSLIIFCHVSACLFYLITFFDDQNNFDRDNSLIDLSTKDKYLTCLYWVVQTVITVGYGDIKLRGQSEQTFAILLMICGVLFVSVTVSLISEILLKNNK